MDLYEQAQVYTAPQYLWQDDSKQSVEKTIALFKRFIKEFKTNTLIFHYRDMLMSNIEKELYYLEVRQEDLINFDATLSRVIQDKPSESIAIVSIIFIYLCFFQFEKGLKEVVLDQSIKYSRVEEVPEIQFLLYSLSDPRNLRELNSNDVGRLISISGIIVSCTSPSIKAKSLSIQCRSCGYIKTISVASGFGGVNIPRVCDSVSNKNIDNSEKCPLDSYMIVPEMCEYIDQQTLKIQETPESIPTGEIPRSFQLYCERYLVNRASPGTRLSVTGVYMANEKSGGILKKGGNLNDINQKPYIKVVGIQLENQKSGKSIYNFSNEDEQKFLSFSKDPSK